MAKSTEIRTIFLSVDGRHSTIARDRVGVDHDVASHVLAQAEAAGIWGYLVHMTGDYHGRGKVHLEPVDPRVEVHAWNATVDAFNAARDATRS